MVGHPNSAYSRVPLLGYFSNRRCKEPKTSRARVDTSKYVVLKLPLRFFPIGESEPRRLARRIPVLWLQLCLLQPNNMEANSSSPEASPLAPPTTGSSNGRHATFQLSRQDTAHQLRSVQERAKTLPRQAHASMGGSMLLSSSTTDTLLSFNAGHGADSREARQAMREGFKNDVQDIRQRLKRHGRATLNPRSRSMKIWDFVLVSALTFTTFVTPFEVAFSEGVAVPRFVLNRIVDVVFVVDVCLAFFMPYRASADLGGGWVYDQRKIARHYMRTFFVPDVLTCIPFDTIVDALTNSDSDQLRLLRMVRILKLARILRASRIVARWQDQVAVSYAVSSLVRFLIGVCVLAHWLACFWGLVGQAGADPVVGNATGAKGIFGTDPSSGIEWSGRYSEGLTWVEKYQLQDLSAFETYGVALYVALNNIFGGSCEINPANPVEFYAQSIMLLLGRSAHGRRPVTPSAPLSRSAHLSGRCSRLVSTARCGLTSSAPRVGSFRLSTRRASSSVRRWTNSTSSPATRTCRTSCASSCARTSATRSTRSARSGMKRCSGV